MIDIIAKQLNDSNIKGIISFGSFHSGASNKDYNDEFSDLDLFVFTKNPNISLNIDNIGWLKCLGKPISVLTIKNPVEGNMITRIMYENLFSVDVILISYSKFNLIKIYLFFKKMKLNKFIPDYMNIEKELTTFNAYLKRGYSIVYDKKNIKKTVSDINQFFPIVEEKLDEKKFLECYDEFWQTAYRFLGKIVRGDIYYGLILLDNVLKNRMVEMIAWESKNFFDNKDDLFYYGKKINSWAEKDTILQLSKTTFSTDYKNNLEVLNNHISIFKRCSKNVAIKKGFFLNNVLEDKILSRIGDYLKNIEQ